MNIWRATERGILRVRQETQEGHTIERDLVLAQCSAREMAVYRSVTHNLCIQEEQQKRSNCFGH